MVIGRYGVPLLGLAKSIYFLADSQKKMMLTLRGGLLVVVFNKPLAFFSAKMRVVISFVSPRYSQHIVKLWKKEIQRE